MLGARWINLFCGEIDIAFAMHSRRPPWARVQQASNCSCTPPKQPPTRQCRQQISMAPVVPILHFNLLSERITCRLARQSPEGQRHKWTECDAISASLACGCDVVHAETAPI